MSTNHLRGVAPSDDAASLDVAQRIAHAPLPTPETLKRRQSLPRQALKAMKFGIRILRVARADH